MTGILWMMRVALAYQRVLIFHWREPADLTNFLAPNEVRHFAGCCTPRIEI